MEFRIADTFCVFNGPPLEIRVVIAEKEEIKFVSRWISERMKAGVAAHEFGVFVRSVAELNRTRAAVKFLPLRGVLQLRALQRSSGSAESAIQVVLASERSFIRY